MSEILSDENRRFLNELNKANSRREQTTTFYRVIQENNRLQMFALRYGESTQGAYEGNHESNSYYFDGVLFVPVIDSLRQNGRAKVDHDGFYVYDRGIWNHSFGSPDDSGSAFVRYSRICGDIKLNGLVLLDVELDEKMYNLRSFLSDTGAIDRDEIKKAMMELKGDKFSYALKQKRTYFSPHQWEGGYNHLFDSVKTYDDLRRLIVEGDANTKIFTLKNIVPIIAENLFDDELEGIKREIHLRKHDNRMCDIAGSTLYADNNDTTTVASAARGALDEIRKTELSRIRKSF